MVGALPRTPTGKLQRFRLREMMEHARRRIRLTTALLKKAEADASSFNSSTRSGFFRAALARDDFVGVDAVTPAAPTLARLGLGIFAGSVFYTALVDC